MSDLAPPRFIQAEGLAARPAPPRARKPLWQALFGDLVTTK